MICTTIRQRYATVTSTAVTSHLVRKLRHRVEYPKQCPPPTWVKVIKFKVHKWSGCTPHYSTYKRRHSMQFYCWQSSLQSTFYHVPDIWTRDGSKGVPLNGEPSAFQAFFNISCAFCKGIRDSSAQSITVWNNIYTYLLTACRFALHLHMLVIGEIGRASCRERV